MSGTLWTWATNFAAAAMLAGSLVTVAVVAYWAGMGHDRRARRVAVYWAPDAVRARVDAAFTAALATARRDAEGRHRARQAEPEQRRPEAEVAA